MTRRTPAPVRLIAAALLTSILLGAGCSDETMDRAEDTARSAADDAKRNAEDAGDELGDAADQVGARAAAEDLRARIKANDTADREGLRSIAAINESAADVVGSPSITGVTDTDADGLDDDGKVQVEVGGETACVTLPANGDDTTVEGGDC